MSSSEDVGFQIDAQCHFAETKGFGFAMGVPPVRQQKIQAHLKSGFNPRLTPRELEVLSWSAEGKTALDIAGILCLSQETVHSHVKNAVQKLYAANKMAAVVRAVRLGLL